MPHIIFFQILSDRITHDSGFEAPVEPQMALW